MVMPMDQSSLMAILAEEYRAMRMDFRDLWNSTISADQLDELGWYANPWVFVYKFQQIGREEALA